MVILAPAILAPAILAPPAARADRGDEGRYFNGGHIGFGLLAGADILADPSYDARLGYAVGAFGRIASVMQVVDGQLEYHFSAHDLRHAGADVAVRRHSVSSSVNLHPFFLRVLGNNRFWFTVAGWYLQAGLGLELTTVEAPALGLDDTGAALSFHVGSGIDTPIDDPNEGGGAFWIGIAWRWRLVFADPVLPQRDDGMDTHLLLVAVSYRWNDLSFAHVPRPPELKHR